MATVIDVGIARSAPVLLDVKISATALITQTMTTREAIPLESGTTLLCYRGIDYKDPTTYPVQWKLV